MGELKKLNNGLPLAVENELYRKINDAIDSVGDRISLAQVNGVFAQITRELLRTADELDV